MIVSGDVTVSSQCGHVFHRECIMGWLLHRRKVGRGGRGRVNNNGQQGNDECPHCRQLMWDTETYQLMETELRATWNHSKE
jgi:Ring finger domain